MDKEAKLIYESYLTATTLELADANNHRWMFSKDNIKFFPVEAVYGNIWTEDGEISLDGLDSVEDFLNIDPSTIKSIGDHEIGEEANITIQLQGESMDLILNRVADVKNFLMFMHAHGR